MFGSHNRNYRPEKIFVPQTPASQGAIEQANERSPKNEEIVLQRIEERARKYPARERSFLYYEHLLDRVLSENAAEAYKNANFLVTQDSDLSFLCLTDLAAALSGLETFKDRLPNRYQTNINKVREHAETIKQIFRNYHHIRERTQESGSHHVGALIAALDGLRKIDPELFPADLIDVTDEERQRDWTQRNIVSRGDE